jgi:hypothetical protein
MILDTMEMWYQCIFYTMRARRHEKPQQYPSFSKRRVPCLTTYRKHLQSGVRAFYRQFNLFRILSSSLVERLHHRILVRGVDRAGAVALS